MNTSGRLSENSGNETELVAGSPEEISTRPASKKTALRDEDAKAFNASKQEQSADLKSIYDNKTVVRSTISRWKDKVTQAAAENSIRPDILMAHVAVATYLDPSYNDRRFRSDVGAHAGERVKSFDAQLKNYEYGWTMKWIIDEFNLASLNPVSNRPAVVAANVNSESAVMSASRSSASQPRELARRPAQVAPNEGSMRSIVANQYGYNSWSDLTARADGKTRAAAEAKVKAMAPALRIR